MKQYGTILADPPWMERGGGQIKRGADRHYPLMHTRDICALPVASLALPNCHLYLWVTNNFLKDGLKVMEAWGFRYVTKITWAKEGAPGLGQYFRGMTEDCLVAVRGQAEDGLDAADDQTEDCLFGIRGQPPYKLDENGKRCQGKTLIVAPRGEHSAKPEELRRMAERVSHGPFLELFARRRVEGWDCIGNDVDGLTIQEAMRDYASI